MRAFIIQSDTIKHFMAIILIFAFIMFEGGWDFNKDRENKVANNWASGNTLHSLLISILIYFVFLISSKSKLEPNILFFSTLFIIYTINTYREYIVLREEITESTNNNIIIFEQLLTFIAIIILIYGFIDYYYYQRAEYPNNFSYKKFILGVRKCSFTKIEEANNVK